MFRERSCIVSLWCPPGADLSQLDSQEERGDPERPGLGGAAVFLDPYPMTGVLSGEGHRRRDAEVQAIADEEAHTETDAVLVEDRGAARAIGASVLGEDVGHPDVHGDVESRTPRSRGEECRDGPRCEDRVEEVLLVAGARVPERSSHAASKAEPRRDVDVVDEAQS